VVGERSVGRRREAGRPLGGIGRADADISSKKGGENPSHRKPKVSHAMIVSVGSVGPKARQKCVADGGAG
jgi:hypothetical protein